MERVKEGTLVIFNCLEDEIREYVADKNFYYLTGFSEPQAVLILAPRHPSCMETLFIPPRNPSQERWTGPKLDVGAESARVLGLERVLSLDSLQSELRRLSESERKIFTIAPQAHAGGSSSFHSAQSGRLRQMFPFSEIHDISSHLAFFRMKKSEAELRVLKKAIQITAEGHKAAVREIGNNRFEYEVEAALEYQFRRRGAFRPGFPSIVGSGPNSTILHYNQNHRQMKEGELVVVDVGAEFAEYTADITRTYPVSGKFTARQKEIYDIVLAAQEAALRKVKPGALWTKNGPIHKAAYDYINTHGKDLKGNPLGQYFIHGTSHHLGLDVHDVVNDSTRPLEAGMVITVEPGIYIAEENIGVRIEDDVLVTDKGYELLSQDLPRRAEDIERMMFELRRGQEGNTLH